jgi:hypothetical protein
VKRIEYHVCREQEAKEIQLPERRGENDSFRIGNVPIESSLQQIHSARTITCEQHDPRAGVFAQDRGERSVEVGMKLEQALRA